MAEALVAEKVSVTRDRRQLLRDVSLDAQYGQMLAIAGPNGAGKSTLLKALAGLIEHAGEVTVAGKSRRLLGHAERARALGYVPQRSDLAHGVTVYEVVAQARYAHRQTLGFFRSRDDIVARALTRTGMLPMAQRTYDTLSGGEQRRVLVARALATEARVLLLDEPTAGLDVSHVLQFFALLSQLKLAGYALVCVLHDLTDVRRYAERTLLLRSGEAVVFGPTERALDAAHVKSVYRVHSHENAAMGFSLDGSWQ